MLKSNLELEKTKKMVNVCLIMINRKVRQQIKMLMNSPIVYKKIENYDALLDDLPLTIARARYSES